MMNRSKTTLASQEASASKQSKRPFAGFFRTTSKLNLMDSFTSRGWSSSSSVSSSSSTNYEPLDEDDHGSDSDSLVDAALVRLRKNRESCHQIFHEMMEPEGGSSELEIIEGPTTPAVTDHVAKSSISSSPRHRRRRRTVRSTSETSVRPASKGRPKRRVVRSKPRDETSSSSNILESV